MKVNKRSLFLICEDLRGTLWCQISSYWKAELLAATGWICKSMCTDVTDTLCCRWVLFGSICLAGRPGSAAEMTDRPLARAALQYHRARVLGGIMLSTSAHASDTVLQLQQPRPDASVESKVLGAGCLSVGASPKNAGRRVNSKPSQACW